MLVSSDTPHPSGSIPPINLAHGRDGRGRGKKVPHFLARAVVHRRAERVDLHTDQHDISCFGRAACAVRLSVVVTESGRERLSGVVC